MLTALMAVEEKKTAAIPLSEWKEEQFVLPFVIASREQLESAVGVIAQKQVLVESIKAKQGKQIAAIQARYAKRLDESQMAIAANLDAAYAWCLANEATEFSTGCSIDFPFASLVFKSNPPAVVELEGWSAKGVVEAFRKWFAGARYLRIKFELDKEAIKRDWGNRKGFVWARRGIALVQRKTLTVAPLGAVEAVKLSR